MSKTKDQKPFALTDTLRDLALLRASDLDLAALVPATSADETQKIEESKAVEESLKTSYEYVRSTRAVLKTNDRGGVDLQGQQIEGIRVNLSNVEEGVKNA